MGNVILVTHWLNGDVIPFIRIGKLLKERGHQVVLLTHCYFEKMALEAALEFEAWDTWEEYNEMVNDMSCCMDERKAGEEHSKSELFREKYENAEVRLKEYRKIEKYCTRENTVILCKNRSSIAAHLIAEKYHLPLASVLMNPIESESMLVFEQIEGKKQVALLNEIRKQIDLPPIQSWLKFQSSAKMTLAFWPSWYAKTNERWPAVIDAVGFALEEGKDVVHKLLDKNAKEWLESHKDPILITGGTTKLIDPRFYKNSIKACGMTGKPTIVVTRYKDLLPKELPDNVVWFEFLPLSEILSRISLLIHHGGLAIIADALTAGVPQLILPSFVDRPFNAECIKVLGVGDYLFSPNWMPEKIARLIHNLQNQPLKEVCRKYSDLMKENKGITNSADKVEELMTDRKYVYEITETLSVDNRQMKLDNEKGRKMKMLDTLTIDQRKKLFELMNKKG